MSVKFEINTETYIELSMPEHFAELESDLYFCAVLCHCGSKYFILYDEEPVYPNAGLLRFDIFLTRALRGDLELHHSIKNDIGVMWNEELIAVGNGTELKTHPQDVNEEGQRMWVGERYHFWSNAPAHQPSWLYAKQGKFFLELTPTYPWALCEPEPDEVVVPYEEFMKNYKPILILEIPREALVRWKRQTSRLMKVVASNEKRVRQRWFALRRHYRLLRIKRLTLTRRRLND